MQANPAEVVRNDWARRAGCACRGRAAGQRYRVIYMVDTRPFSEDEGAETVQYEGTVTIMVAGIRKDGDKNDIYRLFRRIFGRR